MWFLLGQQDVSSWGKEWSCSACHHHISEMGLKAALEDNTSQKFNAFPAFCFQLCSISLDLFSPCWKAPSHQDRGAGSCLWVPLELLRSWTQGEVTGGPRGFLQGGKAISGSALHIPPGLSPHWSCLTPVDTGFSLFSAKLNWTHHFSWCYGRQTCTTSPPGSRLPGSKDHPKWIFENVIMEQLNFWQTLLFSFDLCTCTVRSEKCVTVSTTSPVSQGNWTCRIKPSEIFALQSPGKTFEERKCLFSLLGGPQLVSAALLKLVIYANIQTSKLQVLMQRAALECHMEENMSRSLKDSYHKKVVQGSILLFYSSFFCSLPMISQ